MNMTRDQQRLAHAIRALAADPDDQEVRTRAHDAGQRLTTHEVRQVLDTFTDAEVQRADITRRRRE
ncbi:hypothetical protein [Demequina salsinemoris]|uniref:hypothetical protein n=1 Tax=Demequina salsinemoris TaxID=577470 RepID=UPI000780AFB3|nr:hypothetical protein [Demequina salsinemoris]